MALKTQLKHLKSVPSKLKNSLKAMKLTKVTNKHKKLVMKKNIKITSVVILPEIKKLMREINNKTITFVEMKKIMLEVHTKLQKLDN
ncbi:hypothetical protein [Candidatus Phytoplasma prunorum]|uniref:hypothetical protein n=1 Tax=Candidatus Phytoplasma prunorum TaxID=47565 RepID=UPI002FF27FB4